MAARVLRAVPEVMFVACASGRTGGRSGCKNSGWYGTCPIDVCGESQCIEKGEGSALYVVLEISIAACASDTD